MRNDLAAAPQAPYPPEPEKDADEAASARRLSEIVAYINNPHGDPRYRDRAVQLFDDIMAAWDETCCGSRPGGLWWDKPHTQKATASNAGAVITAVRLHDFTFVPGVRLSGTLPATGGKLQQITVQISGSSASHGVVVIGSHLHASGDLGGRRFSLSTAKARLSHTQSPASPAPLGELFSAPPKFPLPALARLR